MRVPLTLPLNQHAADYLPSHVPKRVQGTGNLSQKASKRLQTGECLLNATGSDAQTAEPNHRVLQDLPQIFKNSVPQSCDRRWHGPEMTHVLEQSQRRGGECRVG